LATITIRKEVARLSDPELEAIRDSYRKMMGISDNRGWIYWNGIHGFPQYKCWHHGRVGFKATASYNLFLPWHRAYLLNFENAVRDQNDGAALAWWDWTSSDSHTQGLPPQFTQNLTGGNPLRSGPLPPMSGDPARQTERAFGSPNDLPTTAQLESLFNLTSFIDFQDQLEDIHDGIHGWVGGDMGVVAQAAFDPIFWAHHTMIDRIWYLWQLRHGITNVPPDYLDFPLEPFSLKVSDVLNITNLGYTYSAAEVTVPVGV